MEAELVQALNNLSSSGFWAFFFYSFWSGISELILIIGLIVGVRAAWKQFKKVNDID